MINIATQYWVQLSWCACLLSKNADLNANMPYHAIKFRLKTPTQSAYTSYIVQYSTAKMQK